MGSSVLVTGPDHEPIDLDEAKAHLNIDSTDDDVYISALITAAREWVENFTQRALITQTWYYYVDSFRREIVLPFPKLRSVTAITYVDTNGDTQTLSSTVYTADAYKEPGRIVLAYGRSWPSTRSQINAVRIEYVAGYEDASDVPQSIKHAMMIMISHWYENREPVVVGSNVASVPMSVEALLWPHMVHRF